MRSIMIIVYLKRNGETINRIYSKRQSLIKIYERLKAKIELE